MRYWLGRTAAVLVILSAGCENPTAPDRLDVSRANGAEATPNDETGNGAIRGGDPECDDASCAPEPRIDGTTAVVWFDGETLKGQATLHFMGNYGYVGTQITATNLDGRSVSSPLLYTELQRYAPISVEFIESPVAQVPTPGCGWSGSGIAHYRAETRSLVSGRTLRVLATQQYATQAYGKACACSNRQNSPGSEQIAFASAGTEVSSCADDGSDSGGGGGGGGTGFWRYICVTTIWGTFDPYTGEYEIHGVDTRCYATFLTQSILAESGIRSQTDWTSSLGVAQGQRSITVIATGSDGRAPARAVWLARRGSQPTVLVDTTRATVEDVARAIAAAEVLSATHNRPPQQDTEVSVTSIEWNANWNAARGRIERMLTDLGSVAERNVVGYGRVRALTIPLPASGEIWQR
jgi:hypothetical protein